MKKSIIKYLTIFVIVIIIISFTGYNLDTEPLHINSISSSQLKSRINHPEILGLKYVNLTYGNSTAEYVVDYNIPANSYSVGVRFSSQIMIYKLSQKLNFPITGISLEIKNINVENSSSHYSILKGFASPKTRVYCNNTMEIPITNCIPTVGNNSFSVSFDIVPVYNIYIYHFNGKEQYFQYNFTLKGTRIN